MGNGVPFFNQNTYLCTIMSDFIVSARKYRPATFSSVVGQSHITSTLRNAIERGQLAHAYLFCGPRGVGKTTCARIFAKAINCLHPQGAEACNECESCQSFNEGRSLNIHELDAASNNSVEDIRTLIEQVRIIPQVGHYSVFIIDEVHMLSPAAFNAFLKTLEEPPAHAIFILATTEKHKIIPTILSRCQIYDFNRIKVEDVVGYLKEIAQKEGITADEESLNLIAQKADGGMRDALSMFDKAVSFCGSTLEYKNVARTLNVLDYDTYFNLTQTLWEGRYADALIAFDEVLSKGFSDQIFMAGLNRHMRDLLMAKQADTLKLIEMTGTLLERYRTQAAACSVEFLFGAISILTELDGKIRQSSNRRLLVELGLMKISGFGQKKNDSSFPLHLPNRDSVKDVPLPTLGQKASDKAKAVQTPSPQPAPTAQQPQVKSETETIAPAPKMEQKSIAPQPAVERDTPRKEQPSSIVSPAYHQDMAPHQETPSAPATDIHSFLASAPQQKTMPSIPPMEGTPKKSILGTSLSALYAEVNAESKPIEKGTQQVASTAVTIDPEAERKLLSARLKMMELVKERRPRFVAAFDEMIIKGSTIKVSVPTPELREEILRSKTAMLRRFVEVAQVNGRIELEVEVNEQIRASKPIKWEDRKHYIEEKNPLVVELAKRLGLEAE